MNAYIATRYNQFLQDLNCREYRQRQRSSAWFSAGCDFF